MDRRPLTEIGVSVLIATICAVLLFQALELPPGRFEPLGSGPVPTWTAIVVIFCCLVVILRAVKALRAPPEKIVVEQSKPAKTSPAGGVMMLSLTIVYVAALQLKIANFGMITFIYLLLFMLGMESFSRRCILPSVFLSALVAFGAQYVFTKIFVVDLPV